MRTIRPLLPHSFRRPAIVAAVAVLALVAAPAASAAPLLSIGDTGRAVAKVQRALGVRADGEFGPATRRAVLRFQRRHGVPATGQVGPLTRRALRQAARKQRARAVAVRRVRHGSVLSIGSRGRAVRRVQRVLGVRADGEFGSATRRAVLRFQRRRGIPATGQVGLRTRRALARVVRSGGRRVVAKRRPARSGRLLHVGSRGRAVARVQRLVGVRADGEYGPATRAAVRRFQRRHGIPATGQVGPRTRRALARRAAVRARRVATRRTLARAGTLSIGSRGAAVAAVQRRLGLRADGDFGPRTRAAVKRFQRRRGIPATGQVGPITRRALLRRGVRRARIQRVSAGAPLLRLGSRGAAVRAVQRRLGIGADGIFGPATRAAVLRFQRRHGIAQTGMVGPITRAALRRGGVRVRPATRGLRAVRIARRYLGVPYVWGGMSPRGFDCSGLISYVYAKLGVHLPHYTVWQFREGRRVRRGNLRAGDLVFFNNLGHAGIYVGRNRFIHAPRTGDVVKISTLTDWYSANYDGARRVA